MATTEFIAAIELGSSKVTGIAGRKNSDGSMQVLAYAKEDSSSFIRKGIIYNLDKTMHVDCYLAEGTNILTEWKWINLSAFGETKGLKFALTSTKEDEYGMMTPAYFCLDGITLIEK